MPTDEAHYAVLRQKNGWLCTIIICDTLVTYYIHDFCAQYQEKPLGVYWYYLVSRWNIYFVFSSWCDLLLNKKIDGQEQEKIIYSKRIHDALSLMGHFFCSKYLVRISHFNNLTTVYNLYNSIP